MFGRGRGRGRPQVGPIARDDEGNPLVPTGPAKPPPLYPAIGEELPPLPELAKRDEHLLLRRRQLASAYRASPYYLEPAKEASAEEHDIVRYSDRFKTAQKLKAAPAKPQLSALLTLTPNNFPPELFGKAGRSRGQTSAGALHVSTQNRNTASQDLLRMEELAQLEKRYAEDEAKAEAEAGGKAEGEEGGEKRKRPEEEGAEGEDDEGELEDDYDYEDDYVANYDYDDDEGYDDDDGGADDDAVY